MKASSFSRALRLLVLIVPALQAQEKPIPELVALQRQYDPRIREIVAQHDAGVLDLGTKYVGALDRAAATAQQAGKLEDMLALKEEIKNLSEGTVVPAKDDAKTPAALKHLRDAYRAAVEKQDRDLEKRVKPERDTLSKSLATLVATLTKEGRVEDALLAKKKLDALPTIVVGNGITSFLTNPFADAFVGKWISGRYSVEMFADGSMKDAFTGSEKVSGGTWVAKSKTLALVTHSEGFRSGQASRYVLSDDKRQLRRQDGTTWTKSE